jgi:membrane protease YdiL (CAAX protease family)
LVAGISIPFSLGLNNILILSNLAEYSEAYQEATEALYTPSLPVQIVCVGVIIPIMEEYIFRGVIYKRMRRHATAKRAMISSAIFFGIYHGNSVQMIYAALCGLLLAYLYEKYGSIKAPILAHMLMNIVVCLLTDADGFTWMFSKPIRMALITIGCAALASTVFLEIRKIQEKPDGPEEAEVLQEC